jgi:hypothetical protein
LATAAMTSRAPRRRGVRRPDLVKPAEHERVSSVGHRVELCVHVLENAALCRARLNRWRRRKAWLLLSLDMICHVAVFELFSQPIHACDGTIKGRPGSGIAERFGVSLECFPQGIQVVRWALAVWVIVIVVLPRIKELAEVSEHFRADAFEYRGPFSVGEDCPHACDGEETRIRDLHCQIGDCTCEAASGCLGQQAESVESGDERDVRHGVQVSPW